MKDNRQRYRNYTPFQKPTATTWIQAPLPHCLDTLPKLVTIEGQGTERQGSAPLAPPEEPAND